MPLEATGNIMSFNVPEPTHDKSITIDLPTGFNEKRQVKINGDTYVLIKQRSEWKKIDAVFDKKNLGALQINATSKFEGNLHGEAIQEMTEIDIVTFFFSYNNEQRTIFVECCRKENLTAELQEVKAKGFCQLSAPSPDIKLKTIRGQAQIRVSLSGHLRFKGGDKVLTYEHSLDTAKASDIIEQTEEVNNFKSERAGWVTFTVASEYAAQRVETNKDGTLCVLPLVIKNNEMVCTKYMVRSRFN
ncbi:hypothetical protein LSH36_1906g00005 [Paralvinella palmiformis]|uniref:Uncharacterized protein n=1 Tax=Paralvinella palmiformis TaxID=53620 RepID=A0AAD9IRD3_9ANNE|nr:hypothetical protein LSH36_1906g00005 [Paralvinella palmiformis]